MFNREDVHGFKLFWRECYISKVDSPPIVRGRSQPISASVNSASLICGENDFRCNDGKCIRLEWRCDGSGDCPDGEDEKEIHAHVTTPLVSNTSSAVRISHSAFRSHGYATGQKIALMAPMNQIVVVRTDLFLNLILLRITLFFIFRAISTRNIRELFNAFLFKLLFFIKKIVSNSKLIINFRLNYYFFGTNYINISEFKQCSASEFQCKNKRCQPRKFKCDYYDDCGKRRREEKHKIFVPLLDAKPVVMHHQMEESVRVPMDTNSTIVFTEHVLVNVNECAEFGYCDQLCANHRPGFTCSCLGECYTLQVKTLFFKNIYYRNLSYFIFCLFLFNPSLYFSTLFIYIYTLRFKMIVHFVFLPFLSSLRIVQRFSVGFKFGERDGQFIVATSLSSNQVLVLRLTWIVTSFCWKVKLTPIALKAPQTITLPPPKFGSYLFPVESQGIPGLTKSFVFMPCVEARPIVMMVQD
uniref:Low-density lipoprotein receptor domain class A n=1 Tax=Heterorhabditis bacteriophora TaxID=37862 RepID=A0A1I7WFR3_HETBA